MKHRLRNPCLPLEPDAGGTTAAAARWYAGLATDRTNMYAYSDLVPQLNATWSSDLATCVLGNTDAYDAMVARATRANREGDYFPIWGTCLGFEYLVVILGGPGALVPRAPGDPIVPGFDSELLPRALNLTAAVRGSRMLGGASDALLRWAARENVTYNMHHRGVEPASFASNPRLDSSMSLLASSTDRRGRPFVAAFEGDNLPFYGVQFHPEKIEFVPPSRYEPNIPRTPHAAALSRHLGSFLVSEAAKSLHRAATRTPTAANPFVWPSPSAVSHVR